MIYLRSQVERLLAENNRLIEELKGRCEKLEAERDSERKRAERAIDQVLEARGAQPVRTEEKKETSKDLNLGSMPGFARVGGDAEEPT